MKEKILTLLKQTYSSFGLGDALLKAIADNIATGATEENIESLVASQKPILEAMQKANDKRATDAATKAKSEAEAAAKAAKEEDERKRAELSKQIEKLQADLKAKAVEPPKPEDMPEWFTAEQKRVSEQMQKMMESNKTMLESLTALKDENEKFKAARAAEERANYIIKTARELGVPEWREKEGFNISDTMSDDEIKTYLTEVSNNIRTNMTGPNHFGVPQFSDNAEAMKESAKRVAASLVDQM